MLICHIHFCSGDKAGSVFIKLSNCHLKVIVFGVI
jgi:hypothetical protein